MRHGLGPFWIGERLEFPPPDLADEHGLLAVGGDLRPARLLLAYRLGIFPWPLLGDGQPMLWWCPDPRCVLYPDELHVGRSLRRRLRNGGFDVRFDTAFDGVIRACARSRRPAQDGTWITEEMIEAYLELHRLGYAHSAEAWLDGRLAGGLYGVSLGGVFFGESMFTRVTDASKVAFVRLVERLRSWGFGLVDCQQRTAHLERFGARPIPRPRFLEELREGIGLPARRGRWSEA